jgi:hypothetical protein
VLAPKKRKQTIPSKPTEATHLQEKTVEKPALYEMVKQAVWRTVWSIHGQEQMGTGPPYK